MKEWNNITFGPPRIPTMISEEEKRYLYWLTSCYWRSAGHIVEMGPWLGCSTACMAAGLAGREKSTWRLHTYDNFLWRDFMYDRAPLPLDLGESFRPYFERYTRAYSDLIIVHEQTLPDEMVPNDSAAEARRSLDEHNKELVRWDQDEPIEILFIDGAKSWSGLRHLLATFAQSLLPNTSLLVCQDYKFWGCYWVPMILEFFGNQLELVHNIDEVNTTTFRLRTPLTSRQIDEVGGFQDLSVPQGLALLNLASERVLQLGDRVGALNIQVGKVRFLAHKNKMGMAMDTFRRLEEKWPFIDQDSNLERARQWLSLQSGQEVSWTLRSKARYICRRAAKVREGWTNRAGTILRSVWQG